MFRLLALFLLLVASTLCNFAVAQTTATNYQGLWWNPSESGWGINFAHQGDVIFATWYTYDTEGKPWWLISTLKQSGNTFTGDVLTVRGQPFNSVPWDQSKMQGTKVGAMTLAFSATNKGTVTYSVNRVSQTKTIEKQLFGTEPTCVWGTQADLTKATNYTDLWWNSDESGWGINLTHQSNILYATWFTYDANGQPWWLAATLKPDARGDYVGDVSNIAGPPFGSSPWDSSRLKPANVGTLTAGFSDGNHATLIYTVDGLAQTKTITRQVFVPPGTVCSYNSPIPPLSIKWRETRNSVSMPTEKMGYFVGRGGFGAFDLYGHKNKSFMFPSGREFFVPRLSSDEDFLTFSINDNNEIYIDKNPDQPKYVAGNVTDILSGNFGNGETSLLMIDAGRETKNGKPEENEYSYLWRMDKVDGRWTITEFAQELGRQFWHSSSNPIDVNNDGILDFAVANLSGISTKRVTLFVSNGPNKSHGGVDLSKHLCIDKSDELASSGAAALIRLANGRAAVISAPYLKNPWSPSRHGTIIYLGADGLSVDSKACFDVRDTTFTSNIKGLEGYDSVNVFDINGDGLDDFVILAESNGSDPTIHKLVRTLAFLQQPDSTFRFANIELNLPFTYTLPNLDESEYFRDWPGNEFMVTDINGDGNKDLFMFTQLIQMGAIKKYGIRGGLLSTGNQLINYSIPPESIVWNPEPLKPFNFRYIYPTEINNDGIVDFMLIGQQVDKSLISATNPYGLYFQVSALLSTR